MRTGTVHELLKSLEEKTGKNCNVTHELSCKDGKIVSDFYFFIGSTCDGLFSSWEETIEKIKGYL